MPKTFSAYPLCRGKLDLPPPLPFCTPPPTLINDQSLTSCSRLLPDSTCRAGLMGPSYFAVTRIPTQPFYPLTHNYSHLPPLGMSYSCARIMKRNGNGGKIKTELGKQQWPVCGNPHFIMSCMSINNNGAYNGSRCFNLCPPCRLPAIAYLGPYSPDILSHSMQTATGSVWESTL